MHTRILIAIAGVPLIAAPVATAQQGADAQQLQRIDRIAELERLRRDTRLRVNQDVPPGQRLLFDYGAYLAVSYLTVDDSAGDNRIVREYEILPYFRLNYDGVHEVFVRLRNGYRDFNDGDSFDGRGDERIDGDLDRGFYRFDLNRYNAAYGGTASEGRFTFQAGRDFTYWANGLVLAQTLDGVALSVGNDSVSLDVIAGVTPTRTVDIDTSRPSFDHNTRRGFYGGMVTANLGDHRPYVYGLIQRDYNKDDFRAVSFIETDFLYNSYYIGAGSSGVIGQRTRYGVEAAYEMGRSKSNSFSLDGFGIFPVDQIDDHIRAFAMDARVDYFVPDANQTRLSAEIIFATGDADRGSTTNTFNGNLPGTEDNAFNAFGLVNTGLALAPEVSNIFVTRVGVATFPMPEVAAFRRLQIGADFFTLWKFYDDAPIDEPTGDEHFLGLEPDLFLNWQITSDVTLALRYGIFFPNSDNFGNDDVRQLFFGGLTIAL